MEEDVIRAQKLRGVFGDSWSLGRAGQMSDSRTALGKATEELDPMEGNLTWTKLESCVCGEMGKASGKQRRR